MIPDTPHHPFRSAVSAATLAALAILCAPHLSRAAAMPETPLEAGHYRTLPKSGAILDYLKRLAALSPKVRLEVIGRSAGGLPLVAMFVSDRPGFTGARPSATGKLTVLLIGSQHGTEPSGSEAMQRIARDLSLGPLTPLLKTMNVVIIPVANPDGRDHHRRTNGNRVNLSTDFLVQTQPETRALTRLMRRTRPDVLLDVHESALYKRSTLGAQGYMTDFEAQFEIPTNPNVPAPIRQFALERILPRVLARVNGAGLRAARYVGEITDIHQPITHGGLSLRNIRNYGGMRGILSMLVENRLDPRGNYPTPRNIKVRVGKQYLSVTTFLSVIAHARPGILKAVAAARRQLRGSPGHDRVALVSDYVRDPKAPTVTLPMLKIKTATGSRIVVERKVERTFTNHSRITTGLTIPLPRAYVVTAHQAVIAKLLRRQGIRYAVLSATRTARAEVQHIDAATRARLPNGKIGTALHIETTASVRTIRLGPGDLWIDLAQPEGRLIPLMLDPRASTGIYGDPAFRSLIEPGRDHFAAAIP